MVLTLILGVIYMIIREHKRKSNDAVWKVRKADLHFEDPPQILGRGTFGLVLLAEYRGTQVAVKRVIPPSESQKDSGSITNTAAFFDNSRANNSGWSSRGGNSGKGSTIPESALSTSDIESGMQSGFASGMNSSGMKSWAMMSQSMMGKSMIPGFTMRRERMALRKMKEEFIEEMRYLSRLRHPCITTVMGAVIEHGEDPMLVMEYMDHGSLYDLLHNETMALDGDILKPILSDIAQGVRFLHSADPQVLHGDLKAQNILVDDIKLRKTGKCMCSS